jgi:hypothetical protein
MRFFLQEGDNIRIINEPAEFACSFSQFQVLEPLYPALPAGKTIRYWTPENAYLDGDHRDPCDHDCSAYTLKVSEYAAPGPVIYAHVSLSKNTLCINDDPVDYIVFECHLKASSDPESADIPINYTWNIRVRNESDLFFDAFALNFVNGMAGGIYAYQSGLPLGRYHIAEHDFDRVTLGGVTYTVKLIAPLDFTIYRNL